MEALQLGLISLQLAFMQWAIVDAIRSSKDKK